MAQPSKGHLHPNISLELRQGRTEAYQDVLSGPRTCPCPLMVPLPWMVVALMFQPEMSAWCRTPRFCCGTGVSRVIPYLKAGVGHTIGLQATIRVQ